MLDIIFSKYLRLTSCLSTMQFCFLATLRLILTFENPATSHLSKPEIHRHIEEIRFEHHVMFSFQISHAKTLEQTLFEHRTIPFPFKYRAGTASGLSSMSFCFLAIRRSLVIINGCLWRVTEFECFVIFLFRTCKLQQWQKIVFETL